MNTNNFSKVESIRDERIQAATECAQILLRLKPQVEAFVAPMMASIDSNLANCLKYAVIKAIEGLARSYLSR